MSSYQITTSTLKGESDRGAVLIAAAMLELGLEKLLVAKLVESTVKRDPIFENNGALGTFSAKIEMSYRLGLITKKQSVMFNIFRRIRNEFAHNVSSISLSDSDIRDRLNAAIEDHLVIDAYLSALREKAPEWGMSSESITINSVSPRNIFELIFGLEIEFLNIALMRVEKIKERTG
ncbi:hypothetical protein [Rheinheimera oceanensis]|uniref:hypothetical protein n=1 Tax=Rheinheimera oceanensis TaxID=2817449 RepID=UPI001BFD474F|nr:hypothetical protein [Rheinheimera oceanensis]